MSRARFRLALPAVLLVVAAGCTAPATPRALSVWIVDGGREIRPDSPPTLENKVYSSSRGAVRLQAAINETVAFQLALRTQRPPAGPYRIQIADLVGTASKLTAGAVVSIYRAHYVRVENFASWYPAHTGRPAVPTSFADVLVPWDAPRGGGPLRLEAKRNEIIWVDVRVPPTTEPGEYVGRIELIDEAVGTAVFAATLHVDVLPVVIPSERNLPVICRVDPRDLLRTHLRWPLLPAEQTRILPRSPSHLSAKRLVAASMELFHDHRTTPILWASFPKYRPTGDRSVAIDWQAYDDLVGPWMDGTAFADRTPLARWPIPASLRHPDAERNGGFGSPAYARLLAAYLAECQDHFQRRGWLDRAFVRAVAPEALTQASVDRLRRLTGIVRQSEATLPVVAHLPARSLRGLGWHKAPVIDLPDVQIWAAPAMWFEPEAQRRARDLGKRTWFAPDRPPYSGSLNVASPPTDARVLSWQAFRYDAQAIWIEDAADATTGRPAPPLYDDDGPLIYPGAEYGLADRPVPSIRLKRLRRGLQEYELLRLLGRNGKELMARSLAEAVVRRAHTDACLENLLSCRPSGWPRDPDVFARARELMLNELAAQFDPTAERRSRLIDLWSRWGASMNRAEQVEPRVRGVRLTGDGENWRAHAFVSVSNRTARTLHGQWLVPTPPAGWSPVEALAVTIPPDARRAATIELELTSLSSNADGAYPFQMLLETTEAGAFALPARLAVASCPLVDDPPTVDGDLRDWVIAPHNTGGDFRLTHRRQAGPFEPPSDLPTLPTQAFFSMDQERLYVAVVCTLPRDEEPLWEASNSIPLQDAMPWGQDVVEIILNPANLLQGTAADLLILQIKPNGLLLARRGCRSDPPMGPSEEWNSDALVAVGRKTGAWIVELSLPLSALGPPAQRNRVWGVNVTRLDARRGEYSSWSGAQGHCYSPQALGNLVLLRP